MKISSLTSKTTVPNTSSKDQVQVAQSPSGDQIEGMLLGVALGDALGYPTEGRWAWERKESGEITGYPNGKGVGSDDTQFTFLTLESLLRKGKLDPADLAKSFLSGHITAPGQTLRQALNNIKSGDPWDECGVENSAGNGALTRISPILLPHLNEPGDVWRDVANATIITHRSQAAVACSIGLTGILWELLTQNPRVKSDWWVETWSRYAGPTDTQALRSNLLRGSDPYTGTITRFVIEQVPRALQEGLSIDQWSARWWSGGYLLETVPTVLFILSKYCDDPQQAIVRAVNDTWDNDSIASIVGACMGALYGKATFPPHWIAGLEGGIRGGDKGAIFPLITEAVRRFVPRGDPASRTGDRGDDVCDYQELRLEWLDAARSEAVAAVIIPTDVPVRFFTHKTAIEDASANALIVADDGTAFYRSEKHQVTPWKQSQFAVSYSPAVEKFMRHARLAFGSKPNSLVRNGDLINGLIVYEQQMTPDEKAEAERRVREEFPPIMYTEIILGKGHSLNWGWTQRPALVVYPESKKEKRSCSE